MAKGEVFWIVYFLCFIFSGFWYGTGNSEGRFGWFGNNLPVWIMFGLLGWAVFGPIIH
jgi:hypothetical protein